MGTRREELEAAYRATEYRFHDSKEQGVIRIGERCLTLDALLQLHSASTWAYVTACNPNSIALTDAENRSKMKALRERVDGLALPYFVGEGVDPLAKWSAESSLLILGIRLEDALALARRFGQLAILTGTIREPACLCWTDLDRCSTESPTE